MTKARSLRNFFIEPFAQVRMGAYILSVSLLFIVLITLLVAKAFLAQYEVLLQVDQTAGWEKLLEETFNRGSTELAVVLILYIAVLFTMVVRMTHRVYGPVVSINRFLDQMIQGQYDKRCTVRKDDDLKQLVHKLNELAAVLQQKHGK